MAGCRKRYLFRNKARLRKLESCESRFLWKNGSYSPTTWKICAYHLVILVPQIGNPALALSEFCW